MFLIFFILFLNLKSEIILFKNKNDLFVIKIGFFNENKKFIEYKKFSSENKVNNEFFDPFSDEYIETIKIKTWPFSGSTSRILYLGYPVSNIGGSTNKYPNTYEAGIVAFDLKNFNLSSYFITNKNGLGWKIGAPNQKNFISLNIFNDNIIMGTNSGPNFFNFKNDHSVANIIIGNSQFSSLSDFFNNSVNTSLGYFNNQPSNINLPLRFNLNSNEGSSFFNTIIGSFNLLNGTTQLPFSSDFFYKNSLINSNNSNSNFNCVFGNGNLKTIGSNTANRHNILIGNSNMLGAKECNHNIVIGESNLISNRDDKNNFLNLENNVFIGFNILKNGFSIKNNSGIKESIFILTKNNSLYDPLDYINQDGISGSIFIGTFDPTNNINKSNKTYISNVKNEFDNDDFKIGIDNPPRVLLSNKDNRIGTIPIIFDLNLYTILNNDSQFINDSLNELLNLPIKSANLKSSFEEKSAFFFIDSSSITKITNPILSNYLIYDEKQNPIGYEPIYLIPLLVKAIQDFSSTESETLIDLKVLNNLTASNLNSIDTINSNIGNFSGKIEIKGKSINLCSNLDTHEVIDNNHLSTNITVNSKEKGSISYSNESDRNIGFFTNYNQNLIGDPHSTFSDVDTQRSILLFTGKPEDQGSNDLNIKGFYDCIVLKAGNTILSNSIEAEGSNGYGDNNIVLIGDTYINPTGNGILRIKNIPLIADNDNYKYLLIDSFGKVFQSSSLTQGSAIPSSKKFKENIENAKIDKGVFEKLIPVVFNYKKNFSSDQSKKWGLIAEDVLNAGFKDAVLFDKDGEIYGIDYNIILMALMYQYLETCKELEDLKKNCEINFFEIKNNKING